MSVDTSSHTKPFLKWAGGKNWLMPIIKKYTPSKFRKYYEPFLGSGSIFFALRPKPAVLSDLNQNIIQTYIALRDKPHALIAKLRSMTYNKDYYYFIRDVYKPRSLAHQAARIIYLNRTCWNGLYRENIEGKFNVPFGKFHNPCICDENNLLLASDLLQGADLYFQDFETTLSTAKKGDFIFLDPPYISSHRNNGFLKYNNKIFSWADQVRLVKIVRHLDKRGCYILMTNANHQSVMDLYSGFYFSFESRYSSIAADKAKREVISELIISNYLQKGYGSVSRRSL
jgi:DNA adenine methylase